MNTKKTNSIFTETVQTPHFLNFKKVSLNFRKKLILTKRTLAALFVIGITIGNAYSQDWKTHSLVSDNWPNNDVKSYGGNLYVASNDGIFKSTDNGNTWTDLTEGFSGYSNLVEMQFTSNGNIFARKNSFGVVRSLDGGTTWELDTTGTGSNYGTEMLYYDSVSDQVFLGVGHPKYGLFTQSPSSSDWTKASNLPAGLNNFTPVQMTRKKDKLFIIDIYKRVLESSDNGATWTKKNGTGLIEANAQVGPGRFLAIGDDLFLAVAGIWKSSDDGDSWARIDQGFVSTDTRSLYYDGATLYSSTFGGRKTYKSADMGTTWAEFGGEGEWFFKAMAMHNGSLYGVVHSKDSLYILGDGGGNGTTSLGSKNTEISFSLYPNPANETVILGQLPADAMVIIFDMSGKQVYQTETKQEQITLHTENFVNGLYTVRIENSGNFVNKKLLINR